METSPLVAYSWGPKFESNLIEVIEQSQVLSFSAKWLGGKHITKGMPDYKGYRKDILDDSEVVSEIWDLLDEADVVIGQNCRDFDIKVVNARFLYHGMNPPSPYKLVDTKVEAKKYLRLPSNSLDDLSAFFGLGRKEEHEGFPLWKRCIAGDPSAWKKMLSYNKNDVLLTEKLYLKLRPFMRNHPVMGMYKDGLVCANCGSNKINLRGFAITRVMRYRRYQCQGCGAWGRTTEAEEGTKPLVPA